MATRLHISISDRVYQKIMKYKPQGMNKSEFIEALLVEGLKKYPAITKEDLDTVIHNPEALNKLMSNPKAVEELREMFNEWYKTKDIEIGLKLMKKELEGVRRERNEIEKKTQKLKELVK